MTEDIYLLTICLPLVTLLLIFGMRYWAMAQQARAKLGADRTQIEQTEQTNAALADIRSRLDGIEKVLKDVG